MTELLILSLGEGFGLAMDAFSVSMANGLHEPDMKKAKVFFIAFTFGFFQFLIYILRQAGFHCGIVEYHTAVKLRNIDDFVVRADSTGNLFH